MTLLRVGTRGSNLALRQTEWVCEKLEAANPSVELEQIIVKTHGDVAVDQPIDESWPVGAFVGALERALLAERIDIAVHSFKDLQTKPTHGLSIAAVPVRELVHDVLLMATEMQLKDLPPGVRIGTSSPRRAAQMRRLCDCRIVPMRGNVPTRIAKLAGGTLDGVILAAAGLRRLGIVHPHWIDLPVGVFVPAAGQGALAVQVRSDSEAAAAVAVLDHDASRRCVAAERAYLREINAGCHTPAGALAEVRGSSLSLHACLFNEDHSRLAEGREVGDDPIAVGTALAQRLDREMGNGG